MNVRKAAMALAMGAVVALTATACSSDTDEKAEPTEGGLISVITPPLDNPYWSTESETVKEAALDKGYTAKISSHDYDPKKESDLIDTAISNDSVAIVLDPAGADSSIGNVQRAEDAGVPVFLVNAEINEAGIAKSQLVSNNAQGAVLAAQQFVEAMGGEGKYVELVGESTDSNSVVRSDGFKSVLEQYPDLELVQQETADWDQNKGFEKTQVMLQAHPDIKGVISGNDQMALGAIAALKQAKKLDDVVVGGFDGAPEAIQAVVDGELAYTVLQPVVDFSAAVVDQIDSYLTTGETGVDSEKQAFDCTLITEENADKVTEFSVEG